MSHVLRYAQPDRREPGRIVGLISVGFGAVGAALSMAGIPALAYYVLHHAPPSESWKREWVILVSACVVLPIVGIILAGISAFMGNRRLGWLGGLVCAASLFVLLTWGTMHFNSRAMR